MAMTVVLYKGCPVNGGSVASNKSNLANQLSYFNTFPSHVFNVNSVRFGDPIRLGKSIKELAGYNFGYINYGDNFYYFINVLDFNFITETQTEIIYKLDAYETVTNQCNLTFRTSYITKYGTMKGDIHLPKEPYYWVDTIGPKIQAGCFIGVMSIERSTGYSEPNTILIPVSTSTQFNSVLNGDWFDYLNLNPKPLETDVYSFAYCPFPPNSTLPSGWTECQTDSSPYKIYRSATRKSVDINNPIDLIETTLPQRVNAIRDMRKNIVWRCPYGHSYYVHEAVLSVSATSATLTLRLTEGEDHQTISIPCETVDIYSDSWKEYYYRLRDSDKALREIGYQQNLLSGITGSLSGGVNGAIAGNTGSAGAVAGAVAGIGLGMVSAVGNYAISQYYDPKLQAQYDRQAIRQSDVLNLAGDLTSDMFANNWAGQTVLVPDTISMEAYQTEWDCFGYDTELYIFDSDPRKDGDFNVGYIRGAVDISADCPSAWLTEIAQRFSMGVSFR